jgi:hypothetical protein
MGIAILSNAGIALEHFLANPSHARAFLSAARGGLAPLAALNLSG